MTLLDSTLEWDLAGVTRDGGGLYRPIVASEWRPPGRVCVDGEFLLWADLTEAGALPGLMSAGPGMLEGFLHLADAHADVVVQYAQRWGVLSLRGRAGGRFYPDGRSPSGGLLVDPLDDWRHYSAAMRSILNVAAALHQDKMGDEGDWRVIYARSPEALAGQYWGNDMSDQRFTLQLVITELLAIGRVSPAFTWYEKGPQVLPVSSSLFGALVVQLMLSVSRSDGLAVCSACAMPYPAERQPDKQRRNYCPSCRGRKVPERHASRDYRHRLRERK